MLSHRISIVMSIHMQATQAYLEQHGIQQTVENLVNATVKAKPDAPLAFMVRVPLPYQVILCFS